jgi:hypothetical protein
MMQEDQTIAQPLRPRWQRWFTLADGLAQRDDNFLLLRALAASLVIYGHSYAMVPSGGPPELFSWLGWGVYSGQIAVDLFFAISGFLITGSFLRRHALFEFLWARALRIYPAYLFCLLLCTFALGPVFTTLPLHYLRDPATSDYVIKNLRLNIDMAWICRACSSTIRGAARSTVRSGRCRPRSACTCGSRRSAYSACSRDAGSPILCCRRCSCSVSSSRRSTC